ncbi:MAG: hypothetical protein RL011_1681 [Pseudomonadota bacterium]|jgi:hypothetical protein
MSSAFEGATRAAIEEIIQSHAQASKFGYVVTADSMQEIVGDLYALFLTSRSLKAAGDRLLAGGPMALGGSSKSAMSSRPRRF